jgi:glutamine amidotransferase
MLSFLPLDRDTNVEDLAIALEKTINHVTKTARASSGGGGASSLNLCITDGVNAVVSRFRDSHTEDAPTLYFSHGSEFSTAEDNIFRMGKADPKDTVLVASEPLTFVDEDWTLVPRNHMILITGDRATPQDVTRVEMRSIKCVF